nr:hypothetical protein [uncultured Cetobacterium sp.]
MNNAFFREMGLFCISIFFMMIGLIFLFYGSIPSEIEMERIVEFRRVIMHR